MTSSVERLSLSLSVNSLGEVIKSALRIYMNSLRINIWVLLYGVRTFWSQCRNVMKLVDPHDE